MELESSSGHCGVCATGSGQGSPQQPVQVEGIKGQLPEEPCAAASITNAGISSFPLFLTKTLGSPLSVNYFSLLPAVTNAPLFHSISASFNTSSLRTYHASYGSSPHLSPLFILASLSETALDKGRLCTLKPVPVLSPRQLRVLIPCVSHEICSSFASLKNLFLWCCSFL